MIRVDSYDIDEGNVGDWFCYHMTSPYILPPGFCSQNSIPVIPPKGYDVATFDWADYLVDAGAIAAPCSLFNRVSLFTIKMIFPPFFNPFSLYLF